MNIDNSLPADHPAYALEQKLTTLEAALLASDPMMPQHLKQVHQHLLQFKELVHLLQPEDIGKVMAAQQKYRGVSLIQEKAAKAAAKKTTKVSLNDIF